MIALRPYQERAVARVEELAASGARRVLVVSPTGSGKTVCAADLIARAVARGTRALFVAHRREIINQTVAKLVAHGLAEDDVGVLMASDTRRRPGARVQVASIDTLRHRAKPVASLVVIDEAHRSLAPGYVALQAAYPSALHVGLTATPFRADGKGLGDAYDELVVVARPRELIAEGFLVEPVAYGLPQAKRPELGDIRIRRGDYDEALLAERMNTGRLVGDIVEHWLRLAEGRRTVAFAVSVAHSRHVAERFAKAGVRAEHLDGTMGTDERDAILGRLERGETGVVSSCSVISEGWDMPAVKCAILARPTASAALYLQQAGRVLRPWTDPLTGLTPRALILDHAGCIDAHGLPQNDREYSLATTSDRPASPGQAPVRMCDACQAIVHAACTVCPECGHAFPVPPSNATEEQAGTLVLKTPPTIAERRAEWERLQAEAAASGFKPGWAFHRYKETFGSAPPASFPRPKRDDRAFTAEEKAAAFAELEATAVERGYKPGYAYARYRATFGDAPPTATVRPAATPPAAPELEEWPL